MSDDLKNPSRRHFLKTGAIAGIGTALAGLDLATPARAQGKGEGRSQFKAMPIDTVRVGFVGVGGMGSSHVQNYLNIDGVQIKAICDIVPEKVERAQKWVVAAGQPEPTGYSNGPTDFKRMCETEDMDLVMTATPWEWHGLGPVAQCMNINRGDAFDYLVSMSSPTRGLHEYAVEKFGLESPQAKERYVLGDVNTSLIKTKLGKTIILIHDTNLPRPYTRVNLVQGTKGIAHNGRTGSTSKEKLKSPINGTISRSLPPSSSTRSGKRSPQKVKGEATAAWTISRTIA